MRDFKELDVTLPETYLREYDELLKYYSTENVGKIKEASVRMNDINWEEQIITMKNGYENMANINLNLSELALTSDNDALWSYESVLRSGSEESGY